MFLALVGLITSVDSVNNLTRLKLVKSNFEGPTCLVLGHPLCTLNSTGSFSVCVTGPPGEVQGMETAVWGHLQPSPWLPCAGCHQFLPAAERSVCQTW